jgi:hypothetical protein
MAQQYVDFSEEFKKFARESFVRQPRFSILPMLPEFVIGINEKGKEMSTLFEVAVVLSATRDEQDRGEDDRLLVAPVSVMAANREAAIVLALQKVKPAAVKENEAGRLKVLVRPFVA